MRINAVSLPCIIFLFLFTGCNKDPDERTTPVIHNFTPERGAEGTEVIITGNGFSSTPSDNVVAFNGVNAAIVSANPTLIKVNVPEGATSGPVSVSIRGVTTTTEESFIVLPQVADDPDFYFGADLSYVNQILDHGGVYKDENQVRDPYRIFADHGTDLVRFRLWHNPVWTKEVYTPEGEQLYNDLYDVARGIRKSKANGMKVLLDLHYSDFWADPGRQEIPAAWLNIKHINVLRDSVYNYTAKVLQYLDDQDLMPEFVQIGNEINCGMLYEYNEKPVEGFPSCNVCDGQWNNLRTVINSGIKAVRDVASSSAIQTKIILHVADPVNVNWWFDNVTTGNAVNDFEIIGFSYYPIWHTGVPIGQLSDRVAEFKETYEKDVWIMEVAYPWTTEGNDNYGNLFGAQTPLQGFPYTPQGQLDIMKTITQELIQGRGSGIIYWEPAWITSSMRDYWNTGSSWENSAFFNFDGNLGQGVNYMTHSYAR